MFTDWFFDNPLLTIGFASAAFARRELLDRNPLSGASHRRIIYAPNGAMKHLHASLRTYLAGLPIELSHATACRPGCSARVSLEFHRRSRYFALFDIRSAYGQVDGGKLAAIIGELDPRNGISEKVAKIFSFLRRFCLVPKRDQGLAIGAPASPDLFNLYAGVLIDQPLHALCDRWGLIYTRYLDDLVFSANRPIGHRKRREIRRVLDGAGLPIAHHKSVVHDLTRGPLKINGYLLHPDGRVSVPGHFHRRARGLTHLALKGCPEVTPARLAGIFGVLLSVELNLRKRRRLLLSRTTDGRLRGDWWRLKRRYRQERI